MKKVFLLMCVLTGLSACVEVKDPNQEDKVEPTPEIEKPVIVEEASQLIVDQPLYLYEGRVLTLSQFQSQKIKISDFQPSPQKLLHYKYDRMEIREEGVLYTLGQSVRIEVGELVSAGKIETFPPGVVAARGKNGASGGILDLQVAKAEGILLLILRGQNGGQGLDGPAPDEALVGAPGIDISRANCTKPGTFEMWMGGKGKKGYRGLKGGNGGDSGSAKLVLNNSTLRVAIKTEPGVPGLGGAGREGGRPGPRGKIWDCLMLIGAETDLSRFPHYKTLYGETGDRGETGKNGAAETSIVDDNGKIYSYN